MLARRSSPSSTATPKASSTTPSATKGMPSCNKLDWWSLRASMKGAASSKAAEVKSEPRMMRPSECALKYMPPAMASVMAGNNFAGAILSFTASSAFHHRSRHFPKRPISAARKPTTSSNASSDKYPAHSSAKTHITRDLAFSGHFFAASHISSAFEAISLYTVSDKAQCCPEVTSNNRRQRTMPVPEHFV